MQKTGRIGVKAGIYTAVMGALGMILSLLVIPVAPNIHINLYVLPAVLVGGTSGILLGGLAGFIGSLYTPVLWGWLGAIPYAAGLGLGAGFFARRGMRPTLGAIIAHLLLIPYNYWAQTYYLGVPIELFWIALGTTSLQLIVAGAIAEGIMSSPALKKRLPKMEIRRSAWVPNSKLFRHPWLTDAPADASGVNRPSGTRGVR